MVTKKVGKYEVGRTIGEGTFAKVKFAHNSETGGSVAMKVLAKSTILKHKMVDQIRREISIMKIVRHPNIVRLHEVWVMSASYQCFSPQSTSFSQDWVYAKVLFDIMTDWLVGSFQVLASQTKIYIILEFVTGGELFDKIVRLTELTFHVHQGRLKENTSRRFFQQLIDAVVYCHSKGVYHRDLKPENLLLDSDGNIKISDFGLSALPQQGVGLLHTTCGTPNYVAPEVRISVGYVNFEAYCLSTVMGRSDNKYDYFVILKSYFCIILVSIDPVLGQEGYDGSAADVWSCGVILFVLMAGYLPFDEIDLATLYTKHLGRVMNGIRICERYIQGGMHEAMKRQEGCVRKDKRSGRLQSNVRDRINAADFTCPPWFSPEAKSLICRILDPNPKTRITIEGIRNDVWFRINYVAVRHGEEEEVNLDDVHAVFNDIEDHYVCERREHHEGGPLMMNAFEMITLSQGLNLSALFDRRQDYVKRQTRFVSQKPAKSIISNIEVIAESMGMKVHSRNYKMRLEGISANKMGQLAVVLEVFEVAPSLFMVDVRKAAGDTLEYHKFYKNLCSRLEHIIWKPEGNPKPALLKAQKDVATYLEIPLLPKPIDLSPLLAETFDRIHVRFGGIQSGFCPNGEGYSHILERGTFLVESKRHILVLDSLRISSEITSLKVEAPDPPLTTPYMACPTAIPTADSGLYMCLPHEHQRNVTSTGCYTKQLAFVFIVGMANEYVQLMVERVYSHICISMRGDSSFHLPDLLPSTEMYDSFDVKEQPRLPCKIHLYSTLKQKTKTCNSKQNNVQWGLYSARQQQSLDHLIGTGGWDIVVNVENMSCLQQKNMVLTADGVDSP
ncbi:Son of sevenless 2 [Asimina triloba]